MIFTFFYPHSSQMKNRLLICICMTQFSQNMFCCVMSIFVNVQCVFSEPFLTPFTIYPPSCKKSKTKVWISWITFFFSCHLKSSMSLNSNNLLSLSVYFLKTKSAVTLTLFSSYQTNWVTFPEILFSNCQRKIWFNTNSIRSIFFEINSLVDS